MIFGNSKASYMSYYKFSINIKVFSIKSTYIFFKIKFI